MQNRIRKPSVWLFIIMTVSLNLAALQSSVFAADDDKAPGAYDGRIVISKNFNYTKKNVAFYLNGPLIGHKSITSVISNRS